MPRFRIDSNDKQSNYSYGKSVYRTYFGQYAKFRMHILALNMLAKISADDILKCFS